jgi:UDP-glucose 4-epimerase
MEKVLVTGARGFLGSALCTRLLDSGVEVHAVSRTPAAQAERWWSSVAADGRDATRGGLIRWWNVNLVEIEATRTLIRTIRPDTTFHLASLVTGDRSIELVRPIFENNFVAALNLLVALAETSAGRLVLAGSSEEPRELNEAPGSPYAAAKWSASNYGRMFYALYQLPIIIAKIFMVYGPGQRDKRKLIPYVTASFLRGEAPRLSSGDRLIDWIYVDDVVEGLIRCGQVRGIEGRTIELGSGGTVSIRDMVYQLRDIIGSNVDPQFGALPDRPLERVTKADTVASNRLLGWQPFTSLRNGLTHTIRWYETQLTRIVLHLGPLVMGTVLA